MTWWRVSFSLGGSLPLGASIEVTLHLPPAGDADGTGQGEGAREDHAIREGDGEVDDGEGHG